MIEFVWADAYNTILPLGIFVLGMILYALFIFHFYKFLASRDIFRLNLERYNRSTNPFFKKTTRIIFYFLEYILFLPILIFFWFAILSIMLAFLMKTEAIDQVLLVSISVVSAVRVAAYYDEDLAKDLAKLLPFTILGIFLIDMSSVSLIGAFTVIEQAPLKFETLIYYFMFTLLIELVMRIFNLLFKGPDDV